MMAVLCPSKFHIYTILKVYWKCLQILEIQIVIELFDVLVSLNTH